MHIKPRIFICGTRRTTQVQANTAHTKASN